MQFNRVKGESWADFCARKTAAGMDGAAKKAKRVKRERHDANADRIDGYDRDNLGESPDF